MNNYTNIKKSLSTKVDLEKSKCIFTQMSTRITMEIDLADAKKLFTNIGESLYIESTNSNIVLTVKKKDSYGCHHIYSSPNHINAYLKSSEIEEYLKLFEPTIKKNKSMVTSKETSDRLITLSLSDTQNNLSIDLDLNKNLFQNMNKFIKLKNTEVEKHDVYELYGQVAKSNNRIILSVELHNTEKRKSYFAIQQISSEVYEKYSTQPIDEEELPW